MKDGDGMSKRIDSTRNTLNKVGEIMQEEPTFEVAISSIIPVLGEIALSLAVLADAKGYVYADDEVTE